MIPEYMRESVAAHDLSEWKCLDERFSYAGQVRSIDPATIAPVAPESHIKQSGSGAIAEHCNRKTFGLRECRKCRGEFLALAGNQQICGRNECRVKTNTHHASNHRAKMRANKATCLHDAGWVKQAQEGRYARYERCRKCNKGRVIGERISTGKKRSAPVQDRATCPHLPEWRSKVKKNAGIYEKCKACGIARVSLDHTTKRGPK
jgi:hypothetical protein